MAMVSRLPTVRMARDSRSRGCVSTLSETDRGVPRAGQHLCGSAEAGHPAPAPSQERSPLVAAAAHSPGARRPQRRVGAVPSTGRRDTPALWGWGQPWQPLGDRSRPGKAEPSGDAGGALSDRPQGLKGRGSDGQSSAGRVPRAGGSHPHSPDPRGAARRPVGAPPLTRSSSAKHRPRTKPSTQATSPKDTPRAAVLERRGKT